MKEELFQCPLCNFMVDKLEEHLMDTHYTTIQRIGNIRLHTRSAAPKPISHAEIEQIKDAQGETTPKAVCDKNTAESNHQLEVVRELRRLDEVKIAGLQCQNDSLREQIVQEEGKHTELQKELEEAKRDLKDMTFLRDDSNQKYTTLQLTPDQKIRLLAELDGWTNVPMLGGSGFWYKNFDEKNRDAAEHGTLKGAHSEYQLPPYLTSYDAIIQLVQKLDGESRMKVDDCLYEKLEIAFLFDATPSQLCDTVLVATGKAQL